MKYEITYHDSGEKDVGLPAWGFHVQITDDLVLDTEEAQESAVLIKQFVAEFYDIPVEHLFIRVLIN